MKAIFFITLAAILALLPRAQTQNNPSSSNNKAGHDTHNAASELALQNALSAERRDSGASNHQDYKTTKETKILGLTPDGFAQAATAVLLAVITGIYVVITGKMLSKIGAQVEIMQKQVHNGGEQLIAAQISNNAMFQQIFHMKDANQQTNRLIEETKVTAEATKKSTAALVESERAWIKVEVTSFMNLSSWNSPLPFLWIRPIINNVGRTPARITAIYGRADRIPVTDDIDPLSAPRLPQEPDYSEKEGVLNAREVILPQNHHIEWFVINTPSEIGDIKTRKEFLYVYGYVDYIDVGGHKRQTRFCKLYWIPYGTSDPTEEGWVESPIMPPLYTEST